MNHSAGPVRHCLVVDVGDLDVDGEHLAEGVLADVRRHLEVEPALVIQRALALADHLALRVVEAALGHVVVGKVPEALDRVRVEEVVILQQPPLDLAAGHRPTEEVGRGHIDVDRLTLNVFRPVGPHLDLELGLAEGRHPEPLAAVEAAGTLRADDHLDAVEAKGRSR